MVGINRTTRVPQPMMVTLLLGYHNGNVPSVPMFPPRGTSRDASSLKCTILALLRKSSCDSFFEFRAHFFALVDYKNTAFGATDRPTYFLKEARYPCSAAWLPINPIVVRIWSFVSVHEHHCAFDALLILA